MSSKSPRVRGAALFWKAKAAGLEAELGNLKVFFDRSEKMLDYQNRNVAEFHTRIDEQKAEIEALTTTIEGLTNEKAALIAENGKLKGVLERMTDESQMLTAARNAKMMLKRQLATALETVARLRGYIDRTLEDDAVKECGPEVSMQRQEPGPATIARRQGPFANYDEGRGAFIDRGRGDETASRHWFDL